MKKTLVTVGILTVLSQPALAAKPTDVGVIGPNGEVMLYYRDGNQIVVRSCAANTVLGGTVAEARRNCSGPENRVPVAAFKQALRSMITLDRASILRPLTPEQVQALNTGTPPTEEQLETMQKELDQIEAFIRAYGPENANLGRRDQLARDLAANNQKSAAIKAANAQIDRTIELITNNTLTVARHSVDQNQFLFTALKQFDPSKVECGTDELMNGAPGGGGNGGGDGSGARPAAWLDLIVPSAHAAKKASKTSRAPAAIGVEDRIRNCAVYPGSSKKTSTGDTWNLVARKRDRSTGRYYEVWKDAETGLVWGDRLDSSYTHYNAVALAANGRVSQEKACAPGNEEAKRAQAGVAEKSFGLPTIAEYEAAEKNGIREVVPNMRNYFFWSASLYPYNSYVARGFYGYYGDSVYFYRYLDYSVRCVGR